MTDEQSANSSDDDDSTDQTPEEEGSAANGTPRRKRVARSYPACSFMEALPLADAIQKFAAGEKVRRLTLFGHLNKSPESGTSRQLITNSNQYGLTKGGYAAEWLELTAEGKLASGDESLGRARMAARLELAIEKVEPFKILYTQYKGNRLPALTVIRDFAIEQGVPPENADECVETFLANARDLGLATNLGGAERLLTFDHLLDELVGGSAVVDSAVEGTAEERPNLRIVAPRESASPAKIIAESSDLSNVCFFVSPIGDDDTEQRRHADLVLGSLIEPALETLGLRLVRADRISKPGVITGQVIDHIVRSPLVVADLSFGNPNVFYEVALRHACRKPIVQLIRSTDRLPFDVNQFRTVILDMRDIYTLVPQIDSYRAEIARQCRSAIESDGPVDSPLEVFYPKFWDQFAV